MKHVIAILMTLFLALIWIIPAYMQYHTSVHAWGILYLPIFLLTAGFGFLMNQWYKDNQ